MINLLAVVDKNQKGKCLKFKKKQNSSAVVAEIITKQPKAARMTMLPMVAMPPGQRLQVVDVVEAEEVQPKQLKRIPRIRMRRTDDPRLPGRQQMLRRVALTPTKRRTSRGELAVVVEAREATTRTGVTTIVTMTSSRTRIAGSTSTITWSGHSGKR